ncbi:MAG: 4'-phosphopantetheinyl transferase superfamily protein [Pseudomonadota bacterium]|nr:4'-phosphopantetheinyl transferase superfamily protein [Pseudomonadota bacterium]
MPCAGHTRATVDDRDVWLPATAAPALTAHEVHVWRANLDTLPDFRGLLAEEEAARAGRFHFEQHRARFIAARGWLRSLLGGYLHIDPGEVEFTYGERGKPGLGARFASPLRFNVSHSHELALIAVSEGRELGVDVEHVDSSTAGPEIAQRFFSAAEVAELQRLPQGHQRAAFFAGWVRKEAYIKAIGAGLFAALDRFTVSLTPGEPAELLDLEDDPQAALRWTLRELLPGEGYAAAIAVEGRGWQLRCFDWPPPVVWCHESEVS